YQPSLQGRDLFRGAHPGAGVPPRRHPRRSASGLETCLMRIARHWQSLASWALALVALIMPAIVPNDYVMGVVARICLYAVLALRLNIVVGFAGLLDLGYVAFFGIGSYVYAFLSSPQFGLHLPFLVALSIVILATATSGILIGAPTLRLRGDYLAIVTLG